MDSKSLPPHPATIARVRTTQLQASSAPAKPAPHPAKMPPHRAAQPRLATNPLPPHPATVAPARAAQPKLAQPARAPHAAKAQSSRNVQAAAASGRVISAAEVGQLLGGAGTGVVATVSRDESGEVAPGKVRLIFDVKD